MESLKLIPIIINSISLAAIAFLCATIKLRARKLDKSLGVCLVQFTRKTSWLIYLVVFFACGLVVLLFFREFQLYINIVLDAVAVLAVDMVLKDFILQRRAGIYTDSIIIDGRILKKSDIIALPTLEYEESEEFKKDKEKDDFSADAYETSMKSLKIVSKSHGDVFVGFASVEERRKAVDIIRKWV